MDQLQSRTNNTNLSWLIEWIVAILLIVLAASPANAAGKEGLQLNGKSEYILVPNQFNIIGDRTFSFWINRNHSENQIGTILYKAYEYSVSIDPTKDKLLVKWGNGQKWESELTSNKKISKNKWIHVTISKSFQHHKSTIYINGKEDRSLLTANTYVVNTAPFVIGAALDNGKPTQFFSGVIKDLQIWNRTFNNKFINVASEDNIEITKSGMVGYYKFSKEKIIRKSSLYSIAKSELDHLDGVLIHQSNEVSEDLLARASVNTSVSENTAFNTEILKQHGKNSVYEDLGVNLKSDVSADMFALNVQKDGANFYKLHVYDILGEVLFSSDYFIGEQEQTFGQELPPGVYLVDVTKGDRVQRLKIMKQAL